MEWNGWDLFLGVFVCLYALLLVGYSIGLLFYQTATKNYLKPFVSVLVAARNEENHIGNCIQHLLKQTYSRGRFEIIIIDDRSSDQTASIVRSFQKKNAGIYLISILDSSPIMAPKKNALTKGIEVAKGEVIICTDADCRPEAGWLNAMVASFGEEVGMVVGFSPIEPNKIYSLFQNFVALDSLALASVAAASSAFGKTLTATGRSLAYRKKTFEEVGGFSKIAQFVSGDDDLLLELIRKTKWKTAYCIADDALVNTDPPATFKKFVNQKIRQASKGRHYSYRMVLGLAIFYVFNVSLITYVPFKLMFHGINYTSFFYLVLWSIKLAADFLMLFAGAYRFRKWSYLAFYPVAAFLHPWYITIFGAWGLFGTFEWKDTATKSVN